MPKLKVRIRGTIGDIDPLNKVSFESAISRVYEGPPLIGLPNIPRSSPKLCDLQRTGSCTSARRAAPCMQRRGSDPRGHRRTLGFLGVFGFEALRVGGFGCLELYGFEGFWFRAPG